MERIGSDGNQKLEESLAIVENERKVLQRLVIRATNSTKKTKPSDDSHPQKNQSVNTVQPKGVSLYNTPRKLSNCRICKELEKSGDNRDLYEAHQGNYPTHCPRWAGMTNDQ